MILSTKAQNICPSLTLDITAKANAMKSEGIDVIGFGAGEPDFNTPLDIQNAAIKAIRDGKTKYTPVSGIKELKEAVVKKFANDNGLKYDTDQVIISTGGKQCLSNAFMAILNPGDEVLIPAPYWVSYPELVKIAGGVPKFVETDENNGFRLDMNNLSKSLTSKTKAIVINSPNNPTGSVYSKADLEQIAEFAKENDLIIISDEMYEKLIYDNIEYTSIASLSQDAYERTIVVSGVSKTYAMTGWRIGYAAASKEIVKLMGRVQSHTTSNPNSIAQYASLEALNGPQNEVQKMVHEFKTRRDYMVKKINSISHISCNNPEGAFYVMVNISELIGKSIENAAIKNSMDFCKLLLQHEKVAAVPGAAFGIENYLRLSYATSMDNITNGLDRLGNFVMELH